jgi:uncharacterized protein DUF87
MDNISFIGTTQVRGRTRWFGYTQADRRSHTWILGRTGTGKSTLLKFLIAQDLRAGRGCCVIDLHGDLSREILDLVPPERAGHVAYLTPVDESPIGLNILERVPVEDRHTVASAVVSIFKDVFGAGILARSEDILRNSVSALLDLRESTLLWLPRFITDHPWRATLLSQVTDPVVRAYWTVEFARYTPSMKLDYTAPILNKIRAYITAPPLRHIFGQWNSKLDLRWLMDYSRILIVDLSKGRLGEDKATLLGKLLVMKVVLAAFSRVDIPEAQRLDFPIYIDEVQTCASPVLAKALSELRKFHTPLTVANQYSAALPDEVREALKGNVGTMIVFRIGIDDAQALETEFLPEFTRADLVNIGDFQAYVRLAVDGQTSRPFSARMQPWPAQAHEEHRDAILRTSRERFGRPRAVVERWIEGWYAQQETAHTVAQRPRGPARRSPARTTAEGP